jgi:hypothetical protein
MNPYLQGQWRSVHVLMMSAITARLKKLLPAGLEARPQEDVRINLTGPSPLVLRNVEIVDASNEGSPVVTAIEVLSPEDKQFGNRNRDYRAKLMNYERLDSNWVEIDLLRSPRNRMAVNCKDLPDQCRGDYLVLCHRHSDSLAFPISLRLRLPSIPIPLRVGDDDVALDLQAVMDRVHDDGPFDNIDYTQPPEPPLSPDDAAWAAELIAKSNRAAG